MIGFSFTDLDVRVFFFTEKTCEKVRAGDQYEYP